MAPESSPSAAVVNPTAATLEDAATGAAAEAGTDSGLSEAPTLGRHRLSRWMGWRLRLLVGSALLGCLALFLLARELASAPHLDASWRAGAQGQLELAASDEPALQGHVGRTLIALAGADQVATALDALALISSPRWLIADVQRERQRAMHEQIARVLATQDIALTFSDGETVALKARPRGVARLPALFWLLAGFGLVLYLVAMVVVLARPSARNLLYTLMALCQSGNLVFIAIESTLELGLPAPLPALAMPLRMGFDLVTAAAIVNAACLHPRRLPGYGSIALAAWLGAAALIGLGAAGQLPGLWWWAQGGMLILGLTAVLLLSWSYRIEPHPFAILLRRFGMAAVGTWALLTLMFAGIDTQPGAHHNVAAIGSMIWYVLFASLLLVVPFLSRSQQVMREFALLAAISTVATSLDLLFVAVFSLGQFASLTLSMFISLAVYAGARQWIVNQLTGSSMLTTERMFEQLYRIAREVEVHPERTPALLSHLLRELFEPLEVAVVSRAAERTRVAGDGSTLLVPIPALGTLADAPPQAVAIRFAHRGRRLFTGEDARLTNRIVEQLQRAVAFDKAVEQGRSEERMRLAQDLHDDIGARLLTLMYKAQSPEMEDYVRHTLQDLKTLTRGLAAPSHRLSHAAAEWKSDLTQRLTAADMKLDWRFSFDDDFVLSVVQWSALTRILRELVSNAIAHSRAQMIEVDFHVERDRLDLMISDNGDGRNPRAWSHGLGLGGVRKRVKQLGGTVEWREVAPRGIACRVTIRELSTRF